MEQKLTDIMKQAFLREQETILATSERMDPEAFERRCMPWRKLHGLQQPAADILVSLVCILHI